MVRGNYRFSSFVFTIVYSSSGPGRIKVDEKP